MRQTSLGALVLVLTLAVPLVTVACTSTTDDDAASDPSSPASTNADDPSNPSSPNNPNAPQSTETTDQGCGGLNAPPCGTDKHCQVGKDCESLSCQQGQCVAATPTDGIKNADETDIDCGGTAAPKCADAKQCTAGGDCTSLSCRSGTCAPVAADDGVQNGDETDVDCGGALATTPRCADTKKCQTGDDCTSLVCTGGTCQKATGSDHVKNGDESDVDCGGTTTGASKCAVSARCNDHADCASDGCGYDKKCVLGRSCTRHLGGDTCGKGEIGEAAAQHVSCCEQAPLTGLVTKLDRFTVTAGRMRAFIERLNGDVKTFVGTLPAAKWNTAWTALVPGSIDDANAMLGPYWTNAPNDTDPTTESKRSCSSGSFGGHTYWTPGDTKQDFTQDELDPKGLNCVGWHLMAAFCAWEGGRLPSLAELKNAYTNGTNSGYPWTFHDNASYDASKMDARLNHQFSYGYPDKATRRFNGTTPWDVTWYVSPPGRFPLGWNKDNIEVAGNLLQWINNGEYMIELNFSWERHGGGATSSNWKTSTAPEAPNGYYAIGARCAYD